MRRKIEERELCTQPSSMSAMETPPSISDIIS